MKLFLSIIGSIFLSIILFMFQPFIAAVVVSGILLGCVVRGLFLLFEIHKVLVPPKEDKVKAAVRQYLEESNLGD